MAAFGASRKRQDALQDVAGDLDLTFDVGYPFDTGDLPHRLLPGHARERILHVVHGERGGGPIRIFDTIVDVDADPLGRTLGMSSGRRTTARAGAASGFLVEQVPDGLYALRPADG